eukprot:1472132-Rhodomonas_salina.1
MFCACQVSDIARFRRLRRCGTLTRRTAPGSEISEIQILRSTPLQMAAQSRYRSRAQIQKVGGPSVPGTHFGLR